MTVRKARQDVRNEFRQNRGGGRVLGESALAGRDQRDDGEQALEVLLSHEPTPDFALEVAEEWQRLLNKLADDEVAVYFRTKTSNQGQFRLAYSLPTAHFIRAIREIGNCWRLGKTETAVDINSSP